MIKDFNSGIVAWTDWNILLDETGGPNHVKNLCFAPIHGNTTTGEVMYTNEFYYIGHFSKFVRPGAKRIACSPSRSALSTTAFINTDGKVAVIVMNKGEEKIDYNLWIQGQSVKVESLPRSIQTIVF
jgi:glucosylceramidase